MMIPGVQKPHWLAPVAQKASAQARRSSSGRPPTVTTERPAILRAGVTQATRGAPSTSTVQQPHWPWGLQPSLGERTPSRSRSTSSRDAPSSSTSTGQPSRVKVSARSAERLPATARAGGVGVVDREPGALEAVLVVEAGSPQMGGAGRVDHHADTAGVGAQVVGRDVGVEEHLVAEARAATGAHGHAQAQLLVALRLHQLLDLGSGAVGEGDDLVGLGSLSLLDTHDLSTLLERQLDLTRVAVD